MPANKSNDNAEKIRTGVILAGSAALGQIGTAIGSVDLAESEDSYYFRVSLPGVSRDESHFTISFQLPGWVSTEDFIGSFGSDGVLEGVVKKL